MIFDSWMKYIVPTAPMNRLIMPGAHNACTAGMNKMSCCQNGSLVYRQKGQYRLLSRHSQRTYPVRSSVRRKRVHGRTSGRSNVVRRPRILRPKADRPVGATLFGGPRKSRRDPGSNDRPGKIRLHRFQRIKRSHPGRHSRRRQAFHFDKRFRSLQVFKKMRTTPPKV